MSTLSSDLVSKPLLTQETYLELEKNLFLGIDLLNQTGATICWENGSNTLANLIDQHIKKKRGVVSAFGRFASLYEFKPNVVNPLTIPTILLQHKGRPVVSVDCRLLGKKDAIGILYRLSQMSTSLRPIVIINNITDLPPEDAYHDDPMAVENLLLHLWKDDCRQLSHPTEGAFVIRRNNYSVLIPIHDSKRSHINMPRLRNDNLAQIHLSTDRPQWNLNKEELSYLEKRGWISSEIANQVCEYIGK
ncbi:MAG: hypothetical protein IKX45_04050 [Bacteroidales bacterium]|nr:hypothetical protein [Bacteroidales bacterium]